jgi:predicted RNA-binding Zn ribbon-like protein
MRNVERSAGRLELVGERLCLDFVNTATARGLAGHRDYLDSHGELLAWGRHAGVISAKQARRLSQAASRSPQAAVEALHAAVLLRETLYRLLISSVRGSRPAAADLACLNEVHRQACLRRAVIRREAVYEWGWEFEASDLEAVLWPVAGSAAELLTSPDLIRLRQCAGPGCQWLFLDLSKNGSRRWCSMALCGSRMKSRRFYRRTRGSAARAAD